VITSGIQMLQEGVPVMPMQAPAGKAQQPAHQ